MEDREQVLIHCADALVAALIALEDLRLRQISELRLQLAAAEQYGDRDATRHMVKTATAGSVERGLQLAEKWPMPSAAFCSASAIPCLPDCPREGHEHPPCGLLYRHDGRHSWQTDPDDQREATDPHAKPPVVFTLPGRPPTESHVRDRFGVTWQCEAAGGLRCIGYDTRGDQHATPNGIGVGGGFAVGDIVAWSALLDVRGPLTLIEDQDDDDARLYGPRGARWGDPSQPCPYSSTGDDDVPASRVPCALGLNHAGPHIDPDGRTLDDSEADGSIINAGITPHEASQTPCTCGHPEAHKPGCPRYARVSGAGVSDGT